MASLTQTRNLKMLEVEASLSVSRWGTSSLAEIQLALKLAQEISSKISRHDQIGQLYQIALEQFRNNIGMSRVWATSKGEITSNLIAEIAYRVESRDGDVKKTGSYFTPQILAADMVEVAARDWLKHNNNSGIENAVWYDPCVGGGIFPVAIADFLLGLGIGPERIMGNIVGSDINPIFAEATRIRLALVLSNGSPERFTKLYGQYGSNITEEDSLQNFSEIQNFFVAPKARVDIVIGNPPYVRSNNITSVTKEILRNLYPSMRSGTADLYMFFIAHGLNALKQHGVLCFVSPASFQRTSSASQIRDYIFRYANIDAVFDFDELEVFQNVSSHISVYLLAKNAPKALTEYSLYSDLPGESPLVRNPYPVTRVSLGEHGDHVWSFHPDNASVLPLLERDSIPLRVYSQIYSGIKTGLKNAYELLAGKHDEILNDEKSKQYIFPLLKPRQIEKWRLEWSGTYQIVIPRGQAMDTDSQAYKHLLRFKNELSGRSDLKRGDPWYSLRDCAYLDLFSEPKIVYRDISSQPRFALDSEGMMVVDGAFFISSTDLFLLGILNSKVGEFYFKNRCATIGSVGSRARLRFKKVYVSEFPIPTRVDPEAKASVERIVERMSSSDRMETSALECELNDIVLDIYRIPSEQRQTILKS